MKVSHNELNLAIKRSFEGLGFSLGDYEDAADILTWLEMHGLRGIKELHHGLLYLKKEECTPGKITYEGDSVAVIDTHRNSGLAYVELAAGLAYTKALDNDFSHVKLNQCHNRRTITKSLLNYAHRGMNCLAYWYNCNDPVIEHVVSIAAHAQYPDYYEYDIGQLEEGKDKQSIDILCSRNLQTLQNFSSDELNTDAKLVTSISAEQMAASYAHALEHGIEIDIKLWNELSKLIERILVESTDESRSGAGA